MKKDVSNKTLALLMVAVLVISVAGTLILLNKAMPLGAFGAATGVAKVNVSPIIAISLPVNTVDFGSIYQGNSEDTSDNTPAPLTVQNDGGVDVNVAIARDSGSLPLFSGTGGGDNTATFQFKVDNSVEASSFNYSASTTSWTNVPGVAGLSNVIKQLNYNDASDLAEVDLKIAVPSDETPGAKQETLVFTATQS